MKPNQRHCENLSKNFGNNETMTDQKGAVISNLRNEGEKSVSCGRDFYFDKLLQAILYRRIKYYNVLIIRKINMYHWWRSEVISYFNRTPMF